MNFGCTLLQDNDLAAHLHDNNPSAIQIDYERGGIGHDLAHEDVAERAIELASNTLCIAVVASPPCSTRSAARFEPGAPQVLRTNVHPMGKPQPDGGLPATVVPANAIVTNCVRIATAAQSHGGQFVFESPVGRGTNSRFAMDGKNEHVDMSTHHDLAKLADMQGVGR
eukprot:6181747-Pleurochrysis_carterae.AAC.1